MIYVIAAIEAAEGRRDDLLGVFRALVPKVVAEEGCVEYGLAIDLATSFSLQNALRENVVVVVEKWESIEMLEAHLTAPHMLEFRDQVKEMVEGTTLQILEPA